MERASGSCLEKSFLMMTVQASSNWIFSTRIRCAMTESMGVTVIIVE